MPAPFPHHHRNHSLLSSAPRATRGEEHTMATATTTAQVCRNFINGRWVESRSGRTTEDRKSTRLNSSHGYISYAVFCLKKKKKKDKRTIVDTDKIIGHMHVTVVEST